jgi:enoyl-CoA hydratase/carnithine racemase
MSGTVSVEQRDGVLLATISNPPHALMDVAIVDALDQLVARAARADVKGVVLTGAHATRFIAHYDVRELLDGANAGPAVSPGAARAALRVAGLLRRVRRAEAALARTPAAGLVALERFGAILSGIEASPAVWVAALNGSAMGGGCELALACDVRLMASGDHRIGQPEVLLGFSPGGGGTQRLSRMIGSARALRLVLDGGPVMPEEAAALGIVEGVVAPSELIETAVAEAARLGSRPKAAIAACKRAVYEGGSMPLADGLRLERAEFLSALGTAESKQAMRDYLEATERDGELPAYDPAQLERARRQGRFSSA